MADNFTYATEAMKKAQLEQILSAVINFLVSSFVKWQ